MCIHFLAMCTEAKLNRTTVDEGAFRFASTLIGLCHVAACVEEFCNSGSRAATTAVPVSAAILFAAFQALLWDRQLARVRGASAEVPHDFVVVSWVQYVLAAQSSA